MRAERVGPFLTIVIPAYDERERLPRTLEAVAEHFGPARSQVEVLVVDDGSRDGTAQVAAAEGERLGLLLRVISYAPNRGKGHAVRCGMLEAKGEAVLLTDADQSVPIAAVGRFLARLPEGPEVVFASRQLAGSRIAVHQPRLRERLGGVFRDLARAVVPGVSDFTCGFKLFRADAARRIFRLQRLWGWGYDVEIALIARRLQLFLVEEPVEWQDDARTRVHLVRDVVRSAADLVRIVWNDRRGRYREG